MGSDEDRFRKPNNQRTTMRAKLQILLLVVSTNLISIYLFSGAVLNINWPENALRIHLWDSERLLRELNVTQFKLSDAQSSLSNLETKCSTSSALLEALLTELGRLHGDKPMYDDIKGWPDELFGELKLAAGPYKLPLGFTSNIGSDELYPTMGFACRNFQPEVIQYMTYEPGNECPSDDLFAQRLMLKGCEPLPRRRCKPKSPTNYSEPHPFPSSLWKIPPDSSIIWDPYTCKNYTCLVNRGKTKGSYDCKDCFDLRGREKVRWMIDNGNLGYSIDNVLRLKPPGTIRIGLDIGGGTGSFAARMRERNITIVTSSMNFDGPFNNFIASRGLVPLHISIAHRLPFGDGVLDIVHSMHVLSNWIPDTMLEFALYDIYRVLRPGGVFWLDHFFCLGGQLNGTYVPMFDKIGFKKLRWNAGRKLDRGLEKNEWYISALLEKPMN
ncbi:methyltransferase PMT18 [Carex littledalei]|uniref:Methyltransferase PMT18 n=1 Tax=Carex littledalei TaxID=544730 RepID=A0A833VYU6_9POAL|nr:methyltransferase PMT18 [Carex littledalei]